MTRRVLHVVPGTEEGEDNWLVKEKGEVVATRDKKTEAIRAAQEIIASQIVIHTADGKIQKEYTYGLDPRETKG